MYISAVRNAMHFSRILSGNKSIISIPAQKTLFTFGQKGTSSITRSLSILSRNRNLVSCGKVRLPNTYICSCGVHSKGDEELVAFLNDEIENEKKNEKNYDPSNLEGFQVELKEADVTLTKKFNNEIIKIKSNVNNSVDAEESVLDPNENKEPQVDEMLAKPDFTIEIMKKNKVLTFHCTYYQSSLSEEPGTEPYHDVFSISEISIHEGEFQDQTYTVSGDIMDGYLYDLLMNYLEERGISNEFVDKLTSFFTSYEHKLYVGLLHKIKSFVEK